MVPLIRLVQLKVSVLIALYRRVVFATKAILYLLDWVSLHWDHCNLTPLMWVHWPLGYKHHSCGKRRHHVVFVRTFCPGLIWPKMGKPLLQLLFFSVIGITYYTKLLGIRNGFYVRLTTAYFCFKVCLYYRINGIIHPKITFCWNSRPTHPQAVKM